MIVPRPGAAPSLPLPHMATTAQGSALLKLLLEDLGVGPARPGRVVAALRKLYARGEGDAAAAAPPGVPLEQHLQHLQFTAQAQVQVLADEGAGVLRGFPVMMAGAGKAADATLLYAPADQLCLRASEHEAVEEDLRAAGVKFVHEQVRDAAPGL
jgi:hypothetical protein